MPIVSNPLVVRIFVTRGPNGWSERWPLNTQDWDLGLAWAASLAEARRHLLCADSWIEWASLAMIEPPYWEQCVITSQLAPLPQWGVNASDMQGLLWGFETGTGGWSNHLFRALDKSEIYDKHWIRKGLQIPDTPPALPADLTTASKHVLYQNTLATFRQYTATCQPLPPLIDDTPQYLMDPFDTVAFNVVSSRMVGGPYKRVSWESMARSATPAFSPCGMAVSVLRRCYQWRCRFYAGYPVEGIRYYFSNVRAAVLPIPTIFYGWNRAKENSNGPLPGEVGRPPKSAHTSGLGFSTAPGAAYDGDPLGFIGEGSVTWTPYIPTPPLLMPPCDAAPGPIVGGVGGLALGGPGAMWVRDAFDTAEASIVAAPIVEVAANSVESAGSIAASAAIAASSETPAEGAIQAAAVEEASSQVAGEGDLSAEAAVVASSEQGGTAGVAASAGLEASSLDAAEGAVTAAADEVASSLGAGEGDLSAVPDAFASSEQGGTAGVAASAGLEASSLDAAEGAVTAAADEVASSLGAGEGDLSAEADVVANSEQEVLAEVAASAELEASSLESSEASLTGRASTVASSEHSAEGAVGAHASVVASNHTSGAGAVRAAASVLANERVSGEAGIKAQSSQSAGATYLLHDTFTDTNGTALSGHTMDVGPGWTYVGGTWSIQSNQVEETSTGSSYNAISNAGSSAAASGTYAQVDIIVPASGGMWGGLNCWGNGTLTTNIEVVLTGSINNTLGNDYIATYVNGASVNTTAFTISANTTYTLKVMYVSGTGLKIYVNGVLKVTINITPSANYNFGIVTQRNATNTALVLFDNFIVAP